MKARTRSLVLCRSRHRERGATLLIALIVLVALTMAGIAMMRSVDTATIVAGNIGFRQSTVNAADQGVQAAYAYISPIMATLSTNGGNDPANGYTGFVPLGEAPDWYLNASNPGWTNAVSCNGSTKTATACNTFAPNGSSVELAGNNITYVIHRLCDSTGTNCGQTQSGAATASGVDQSAPNFFVPPPSQHFRVTVRATGPRNSVTYVQTLVRGQ
jgi:Tfp pilus assembly protein PilX